MKFSELIKLRQSDRKYQPHPIEADKLERCLEAARLAPSASNSQPWTFLVVTDPDLKEKVARQTFDKVVTFNKFVVQAPSPYSDGSGETKAGYTDWRCHKKHAISYD